MDMTVLYFVWGKSKSMGEELPGKEDGGLGRMKGIRSRAPEMTLHTVF